MNEYLSYSASQTEQYGLEFAQQLKPGAVLALYGELGSGKTTFTKGLAKGLGIKARITSPTYVLMRDYDLPQEDNAQLHHLDLYRLGSSDDLKSLNLNELVNQEKNIYVIEWAEKANQDELKNAIRITFEILSEQMRKITVSHP